MDAGDSVEGESVRDATGFAGRLEGCLYRYQRNGRLISLLTDFGRINPCYPDFHGDSTDIIHYTGSGRRGDQKLDAANRALLDSVENEICVPLFNKLAPGCWEFLGQWRITNGVYIFDESQSRMVWKFTLEKVIGDY